MLTRHSPLINWKELTSNSFNKHGRSIVLTVLVNVSIWSHFELRLHIEYLPWSCVLKEYCGIAKTQTNQQQEHIQVNLK